MEELKCPFNQTLRSEVFGCAHGVAVTRRDGPDVCCSSQPAQERCSALYQRLKQGALPAFGVDDDPQRMPHSILVKIQFGGLLGLQRSLGVAPSAPGRVDNIDAVVEQAVATYGSLTALPFPELTAEITSYNVKRRRRR